MSRRNIAINSPASRQFHCWWSQQFVIKSFSTYFLSPVSDSAIGTNKDDMSGISKVLSNSKYFYVFLHCYFVRFHGVAGGSKSRLTNTMENFVVYYRR